MDILFGVGLALAVLAVVSALLYWLFAYKLRYS